MKALQTLYAVHFSDLAGYEDPNAEFFQREGPLGQARMLKSQKVLINPFCKSFFPHKSVNLSFSITNINNKLTDLRGD